MKNSQKLAQQSVSANRSSNVGQLITDATPQKIYELETAKAFYVTKHNQINNVEIKQKLLDVIQGIDYNIFVLNAIRYYIDNADISSSQTSESSNSSGSSESNSSVSSTSTSSLSSATSNFI